MTLLLSSLKRFGSVAMPKSPNIDNNPTFVNEVLLPQHLNLTVNEAKCMAEPEFRNLIEQCRLYIVGLIQRKYQPFGKKLSEIGIIENLKKLNNEIGVNVIPIPCQSKDELTPSEINVDDCLRYNPTHTQGINHWFFEMWTSDSSKGKSPIAQFMDSQIFFKYMNAIIKKNRFKISERNSNPTIIDCIMQLRISNGSRPAYNFPSALAKWVYLDCAERIVNNKSNDFYILDPCMGYGGRLGGALAACNHPALEGKTVHYYGTDVNSATHNQFEKIESYWKEHINTNIDFRLHKSLTPAELLTEDSFFATMKGKFHIALTSPPYFDTEQYSEDADQSYRKYPYYDRGGKCSWRIGFLKRMIENTYDLLQEGGEFWLNVADIRSSKNLIRYPYIRLENDAKKFAIDAGFTHVLTYNMLRPSFYGILENQSKNKKKRSPIQKTNTLEIDGKERKFEPIFVFKKLPLNQETATTAITIQ